MLISETRAKIILEGFKSQKITSNVLCSLLLNLKNNCCDGLPPDVSMKHRKKDVFIKQLVIFKYLKLEV